MNPSLIDQDGSAADRFYEIAESLNVRGAMEMAVPFYRQAFALLVAERDNLQAQLGGAASTPVGGDLPLEALHGLLKSAEALGSQTKQDQGPSMDDQIQELAAELNQASALQVMAGLRAIAEGNEQPMPAAGLALLAKAQMLLGKTEDGLKSFEAALAAEPDSIAFQINTGAARLAEGDVDGALMLLRGVYNAGVETLELKILSALLKNLSVAEARADHLDEALRLRLQWFQLAPESVPVERWLKWAKEGLASSAQDAPARSLGLDLLKALLEQHPQDRKLMQGLADALEDQGDYREASLLYRELLRSE
ncbi:hypothetical protein [Synechococcus sp. ROS8604]|uniref:hypothetical protein n=1 Tax=Synechococcus sp. ROS8604 TaxID=1442557 RepID=UPI001CA4455E|nr:hypothetical protein [Synechococcus sp. ROS8604]